MRKHLILLLLMSLKLMTYGQPLPDIDVSELLPPPMQAQALHYWFDGNSKNILTVDGLTGTYSLDVSALSDGIHTLYYQVIGEDGMGYGIAAQVFLKMTGLEIPSLDEGVATSKIQYWFDGNADNIQTLNGQAGVYALDVSSLSEGMHSLYCQIIGMDGVRYGLASEVFLKMPDIEAPTIEEGVAASNLQYWFDSDAGNIQTVNGLTGVYTLDVSSLEDGVHTLHYQVMGEDGQRYGLSSQVFLKMTELEMPTLSESIAASKLEYWIDENTENMQTVNGFTGGYVLDASSLEDGLHTLHYQVTGVDGKRYGLTSQVFVKMTDTFEEMANITKDPVLGYVDKNGITQYKYWLNENDATMQTETLNEMVSPFTLLALLPIKGDSIRSSNFLFETKSGKPMLYAKDDFHIRFIDAAGYWADGGKPIIDYGTSREVVPERALEGFTCNVSMQKPDFNEIHWYTFEAAPGDTTAIKLSQPATIQVFAPSGEEVFKTSEYESTKWDGIHTWEEGTYYLAVHDVTGSKETMTLEYMHMDKYDVVDWDVHTVGNGGCSTITFKGNGFRDLYAVDLVIATGDTIHSVAVSHDSDAETSVTFDFTDATLGVYNAVFHFTEEDKYITNVVTVEEAVDIELATEVSFPSTFMSGSTITYTYTITNTGNMTAYCVPVYIYCETPSIEGITHLELDGLNLSSILEGVNLGNLNPTEREDLETWAKQKGDDHYFIRIKKEGKGDNDSVIVRSNYFTITLPPYGNRVLRLQLTSSQAPNVWFTSLKSLPPFSFITSSNPFLRYYGLQYKHKAKRNVESIKDWYCCIRERTECMLDRVSYCLERTSLFGTDAAIALATSGLVLGPEMLIPSAVILEAAQGVGSAGTLLNLMSTNSKVYGNAICSDANTNILDAFKKSVYEENRQSVTNTLGNAILDYYENNKPWNPVGTAVSEAKHIQETMVAAQHGITYGMNAYLWGNEDGNQPLGLAQCMAFKELSPDCIPDEPEGGTSTPIVSYDPNDMIGYVAESGSKAIKEDLTDVFYTIQFENDTVFATAPAHDIYLTDTLDVNLFDLSTYRPMRITIGNKSMELTGERNFISTLDMRPEINAIAQIHGTIDDNTGIVRWHISSLDPMTMEPTTNPMVGVLPVNFDGSGLGEASYNISLKPGLTDGTIIPNRSGNIFDYNETMLTPTWINIVDAVSPTSTICDFELANDTTLRINVNGFDARSGIWKYELHAQYGENAPWVKVGETDSTYFDFRFYEDIDYGFCVLATDSAGNVEKKLIKRERGFKAHEGDYEDTIVQMSETTTETEDAYDISGRKVGRKAKGIIIRNNNGTNRKVLVK